MSSAAKDKKNPIESNSCVFPFFFFVNRHLILIVRNHCCLFFVTEIVFLVVK